MSTPIVAVTDFNLVLGGKKIVDNLSFEIQPGEVFAFLGANGSGKTSTIRSLLRIYKPTSGTLLVEGKPYSPSLGASVGYLPEERGLYTRSKVLDTMVYFGELKGMSRTDAKDFSLAFLDRVGLADKAYTKIKKLSGGQQQKIQLGVAIMNNPTLLILDEPTKGLDPVNRKLLLDLVNELQQKGTAVIYITHLMEEVERLADKVMIIKDGKRRAYGTVAQVKKYFGKDKIEDIFVEIYEEENKNEQ
ncbi:ABC transporter ATP-binding protein [Candidatus Saccharibacteria bacterium]|nr:MAG: ABC transporter ATP-binding protein [Candidatus Saccharibacteria bacterium]